MTIVIEEYAEKPVEVDLWGTIFTVVKVTKDNEDELDRELAEIGKRAKKLDLEKHANQIKNFAERMDVLLLPIPGGKKKPSKVIEEKWNAGDLTVVQVNSFWANVQEEINRPT